MEISENGSSEIATMMAITLLMVIATQQSRLFLGLSSLMRDTTHSERVETTIKNELIQKLLSRIHESPATVRCVSSQRRVGTVSRSLSLCIKEPASLDALTSAFDFQSIFHIAHPCPLREGATTLTNRRPKSRNECVDIADGTPSPIIVRGDLNDSHIIEFDHSSDDVLIAATGSISINTLFVRRNTFVLSLGDIQINSVLSDTDTPHEISLIAPLGEIVVSGISPSLTIRHWTERITIPRGTRITQWSNAGRLPLTPLILIGTLNKPLGAAP